MAVTEAGEMGQVQEAETQKIQTPAPTQAVLGIPITAVEIIQVAEHLAQNLLVILLNQK